MKSSKNNNQEKEKRSAIKESIRLLAHEKGIDEQEMIDTIQRALEAAFRKNTGEEDLPKNYKAVIHDSGEIKIIGIKNVVDEVEDPINQISLEEAKKIWPAYLVGDLVEVDITPKTFLRTAALTAKQVITQKLRETENGRIAQEYTEKENDVLSAIVVEKDGDNYLLKVGAANAVLEKSECVPGEEFEPDEHIKVYLLTVNRFGRGSQAPVIKVSRAHPGLVKRLFENEVPEIATGIVQIKSIAREAGSRTKIAVHSIEPAIDPVGACVGPRGMRVDSIVKEINNEKIDIIKWSENPAEFIANALSPSKVLSVYIAEQDKVCRVIVPDGQLSLAIGKEGQNARLAAKLTGWRIDIKSASQAGEFYDAGDNPNEQYGYHGDNYDISNTGSFIMDAEIEDIDPDEDITI